MKTAFLIMAPWAALSCGMGYEYGLAVGLLSYFAGGVLWCGGCIYGASLFIEEKQK